MKRIAAVFCRRAAVAPTLLVGIGIGWGSAYFLGGTAKDTLAMPASEVVFVKGEESPAAAAKARASARHRSAAGLPVQAQPEAPQLSARGVAKRALANSVFVRGGGVYGAGIAISDRHVLTCLHVVESMPAIEVSLAEGSPSQARIVERDETLDLAVLETDANRLQHAELASALSVEMGDPVFAMGAPRKMMFSFGKGIVSYVGRSYDGVYFLQTDIAINSGSSGGPVLDERGHVIGISSFILRDSQGLAFALPIDYAYRRFARYFAGGLDVRHFDAWLAQRSIGAQPELLATGAASPK